MSAAFETALIDCARLFRLVASPTKIWILISATHITKYWIMVFSSDLFHAGQIRNQTRMTYLSENVELRHTYCRSVSNHNRWFCSSRLFFASEECRRVQRATGDRQGLSRCAGRGTLRRRTANFQSYKLVQLGYNRLSCSPFMLQNRLTTCAIDREPPTQQERADCQKRHVIRRHSCIVARFHTVLLTNKIWTLLFEIIAKYLAKIAIQVDMITKYGHLQQFSSNFRWDNSTPLAVDGGLGPLDFHHPAVGG
jgi:hypothetical protein